MGRRKNILILTLGTGNLIKMKKTDAGDIFQRSYSAEALQKDSVYYSANYLYRDPENGAEKQYPNVQFIADPLIRITDPDTVIILGTVKSAWSGLYKDFAERNSFWKVDTFRKLYNRECGFPVDLYGAGTEKDALHQIQESLNQTFREVGLFSGVNGHPVKTKVLLTRYGIDDQDLKDNYEILSEIEDVFSEVDVSYHVSFDITHSFRSLPLYNLVILNYLKEVKQLPIKIDHVFYGNFDASHDSSMERELAEGEHKGDRASFSPIVDLRNLVNVLDLTNGVTEFRNTGNAVSLLSNMQEGHKTEVDGFVENLSRFDWAMQINDFDQMKASIGSFLGYPSRSASAGAYEDLESMAVQVIKEEFGQAFSLQETAYDPIREAQQKLTLARWMMKTNRYGNALVEASEAHRTFITALYLMRAGKQPAADAVRDNMHRIDAVSAFSRAVRYLQTLQKEYGPLEHALIGMEQDRSAIKPMRDVFAHNLNESDSTEMLASREKAEELLSHFVKTIDETIILTREEENLRELDKLLQMSKNIDSVNNKSSSVLLIIYSKKRRASWNAKGEKILAADAVQMPDDNKSYNRNDYFQKKLSRWKKSGAERILELNGEQFDTDKDCAAQIFELAELMKEYVIDGDLSRVKVCLFDLPTKKAFPLYTILSMKGFPNIEYKYFKSLPQSPKIQRETNIALSKLNIFSALDIDQLGQQYLEDSYSEVPEVTGLKQIWP